MKFHLFFSTLSLTLIIFGCSTKKDTFFNRNYHSITSESNILYNGYLAFYKGVEEVNATYKDNFWKVLPIEPIEIDTRTFTKDDKDELGLENQIEASSPNFVKAEEKAVKAVQRHSMLIDDKEYNYKIDDAYLLLGKSRYYSSRFIPALEAFNYTLRNYQNANLIDETKIWQAKTLVRLRNPEQAAENLIYMLASKSSLEKKVMEQGNTALAMAYVKMDSIDKVIHHLKKATKTKINREQTARNLFILGQLYQQKQQVDSSLVSFQKILKIRRIPRKYKLHARLQIAGNELVKNGLIKKANRTLLKMTKNYDYKSYLGAIYYQLGLLNKATDTAVAIKYYNKALKDKSIAVFEKELCYQELGDIYFDKADFWAAGKYFDSVLQASNNLNSKRLRALKRRREKLDDIIKNESIAKTNDSILAVLNLSQEEQIKEYQNKLEKEKKDIENDDFSNSNQNSKSEINDSKQWYFYNTRVAALGEQEFKKIWGNRLLEDNWRISNKLLMNNQQNNNNEILEQKAGEKDGLQNYLDEIDQNKVRMAEIKEERNYAYLSLGILYKEQFDEEELAIDRLEKLLSFKPKKEIELLAKYHLFRIFENKDESKMNQLKKDILENFPSSIYAGMIGEKLIEKSDNSLKNKKHLEKIYEEIYCEYDYLNYDLAIKKCNNVIESYHSQRIISKFELLKAYAVGKKYGVDAFIQALDYVALTYPNTDEGKKAKQMSSKLSNQKIK